MRIARTLTALIAAYTFCLGSAFFPQTAYATAYVDIAIKYDPAQGTPVEWCSSTDSNGQCMSLYFFSVQNVTSVGTYSHVWIGATDPDCEFTVHGASRVTSGHGWLSNLDVSENQAHNGITGQPWDLAYKLEMQIISGNAPAPAAPQELFYVVQLAFPTTHNDDYWKAQCGAISVEGIWKSTDWDTSQYNAGHQNSIYFNWEP